MTVEFKNSEKKLYLGKEKLYLEKLINENTSLNILKLLLKK